MILQLKEGKAKWRATVKENEKSSFRDISLTILPPKRLNRPPKVHINPSNPVHATEGNLVMLDGQGERLVLQLPGLWNRMCTVLRNWPEVLTMLKGKYLNCAFIFQAVSMRTVGTSNLNGSWSMGLQLNFQQKIVQCFALIIWLGEIIHLGIQKFFSFLALFLFNLLPLTSAYNLAQEISEINFFFIYLILVLLWRMIEE